MKVLVVNNFSKHLSRLLESLSDHEINVVDFDQLDEDPEEYDFIVLSGGSRYAVVHHPDKYAAEIELIRSTNKPILGICLGFELICHAFGEQIRELGYRRNGLFTVNLDHDVFNGARHQQYQSHRWHVPQVGFLKRIGFSDAGIEAVRHPAKEIYGVQFHPEVSDPILISNFVKTVSILPKVL